MRERDPKGRPADEGPGNTDGDGGYAERGPGRGDLPGRGRGDSTEAQPEAERGASERSRWRQDEADETSTRFDEAGGDADGQPAGGGS